MFFNGYQLEKMRPLFEKTATIFSVLIDDVNLSYTSNKHILQITAEKSTTYLLRRKKKKTDFLKRIFAAKYEYSK